jgi:hypothetical protein
MHIGIWQSFFFFFVISILMFAISINNISILNSCKYKQHSEQLHYRRKNIKKKILLNFLLDTSKNIWVVFFYHCNFNLGFPIFVIDNDHSIHLINNRRKFTLPHNLLSFFIYYTTVIGCITNCLDEWTIKRTTNVRAKNKVVILIYTKIICKLRSIANHI